MLPPDLAPQLVGNDGLRALRAAIAEPRRYAIEPKVDGVPGLIVYQPDGSIEARNRRGQVRSWFRDPAFRDGLARLARRLPILRRGTALDGELTAGRFSATMAAIYGSRGHAPNLRLVVFDVPFLAGVDLPDEPWHAQGTAGASGPRLRLPAGALARRRALAVLGARYDGRSPRGHRSQGPASRYRGGSRAGWSKVKDRSWYEREAWRFQRR
jgi:hypothetical protein